MYGPGILARTLTIPSTGEGPSSYQFGNAWQYHSRSDRHSKIACWGLAFDLLLNCPLLRAHVLDGKVGLGINHELRDFRNNKKKNLDLVFCRAVSGNAAGGSRAGARGATDFAQLARSYALSLKGAEMHDLEALPLLPVVGVSSVLVATEAKAAMTAFLKARPRLKDELTSSHQTIHGDNQHAIAAGLVIVNCSDTFVSPDLNKRDLSREPAVVSRHRQPGDAEKVLAGVRELQRRAGVADSGFDAIGVVMLDCANDGRQVRHVSAHPPAPLAADDFDYERFVHRMAQLYATRFAGL